MKKYIIALTAALATAISASAVDYAHKLLVNKTDGTKVEYKFEDCPVASIEGDDLKISFLYSEQTVLHPIADIVNLTFDKEEVNSVEGIYTEGSVSFGLTRDLLEAAGLPAGTAVRIYDMAGALHAEGTCDADGAVSIPIASLGQGVYLVKAGNNSFKFIR